MNIESSHQTCHEGSEMTFQSASHRAEKGDSERNEIYAESLWRLGWKRNKKEASRVSNVFPMSS
jgi:hypothetical protein